MKKCTQCGQSLNDDTKFCFKCGSSNFEPVAETGGTYQQPPQQTPQQAPQQAPQQSYYAQPVQQPVQSYQQAPAQSYQQPAYQQQPVYQQPVYNNGEPATIGNFLLFFVIQIVPIFNIIYTIMVAVGGPKYKKSMTNFARAYLIMMAIVIVLYIIIFAVLGASLASMFNSYGY